jgi:Dirigent-like protein
VQRRRERSRSTAGRREVENVPMRLFAALACAALAAALPVTGSAARSRLVFTVKTTQGPTTAHPHPPAGGVGDTYVSSLKLKNAGLSQLGKKARASVGTMQFTYTIRKQCTSFTRTCVATADFDAVTTLPGGTVVADGKRISISGQTITIPVVGGTGRYKGARGTVTISPTVTKLSTYTLTLP